MLVGKKIGPFVVDKEIGSGAMGAVYRGRHADTGDKVAIKVVAPGLVANANALKRFKRETAILKQLDHPNIVKLIASGTVHGTPFYVMEFVEGESLDHVMERRGRITWEELVPLGQQLCAALQHAHDQGIIHRDLKPANLMMLADGTLKLADFGIAKDIDVTALTAANSTVGTCAYMSPEQCRGSLDISPKSDLYSMGVVFFEMLTGRKPFQAETVMEMFVEHTHICSSACPPHCKLGKFPRPSRLLMDIPIWLDELICQLLEKKPDKRPFNADKVAEALGEVKAKWETQQSAAVTAVRKRRADKTGRDIALDARDKELGRTLLGKKKKKSEPLYRQTWFTACGISALLLAMALVIYFVVLKPPSPEMLLIDVEMIRDKKDLDEWRRALEEDGPIATFQRYYPKHPLADKMRGFRDLFEQEVQEQLMHNRRHRIEADSPQETVARQALDDEDNGKLDVARKIWESLLEHREGSNVELHKWSLVAGKHLQEIEAVNELHTRLAAKAKDNPRTDDKQNVENRALAAFICEADVHCNAILQWDDLMKDTKKKEELRRWYLLAAKCKRDVEMKKSSTKPGS